MAISREVKFSALLEQARARRTKRGASSPPGNKLRYGEGQLPIKYPKRRPDWPRRSDPLHSEEVCLEAVRDYLSSLARGQQPTKKGYLAHASANGLPSHQSLDRHGGFSALVEKARKT